MLMATVAGSHTSLPPVDLVPDGFFTASETYADALGSHVRSSMETTQSYHTAVQTNFEAMGSRRLKL